MARLYARLVDGEDWAQPQTLLSPLDTGPDAMLAPSFDRGVNGKGQASDIG